MKRCTSSMCSQLSLGKAFKMFEIIFCRSTSFFNRKFPSSDAVPNFVFFMVSSPKNQNVCSCAVCLFYAMPRRIATAKLSDVGVTVVSVALVHEKI